MTLEHVEFGREGIKHSSIKGFFEPNTFDPILTSHAKVTTPMSRNVQARKEKSIQQGSFANQIS